MMKSLAILLALPVIVAIALIAFIPTMISTETGQQFTLRLLLLPFPNTTTAKKVEVSWFGPQKLEQIAMDNPEKGMNLTCDSIVLKDTLFSLAWRGFSPSTISIDNLNAHFNDLNALKVPSDVTKIIGNELTVHLQSAPEEEYNRLIANPISISLANEQISLQSTGELQSGSIQFTQDTLISYYFIEPQSKERLTLIISITPPQNPIRLKNWPNLMLSGFASLATQNQLQHPIITTNFELKLEKTLANNREVQFVDFDLYNDDLSLKIEGNISNDILTLRSPAVAEMNVNALLKQPELAKRSPFNLISSTTNPLKLNIAPQGFQIPFNFDLKKLQAESLQLELGMIAFKREGPLSKILQKFNSSSNEPFMVWFTPTYMSVRDGVVTLNRTDLLLMHTYPLATWGTIDLIQDRLRLILGVPADALAKFYQLPFFKSKEMITLPVVGSIKSPKIDTSNFELKLSALTAKTIGGVAGQIIGSAVDLSSNSEPIPAPTSVVPWANLLPSASDKEEISNKKEKQKESPTSQKGSSLKKVFQRKADSLIKKVLPAEK